MRRALVALLALAAACAPAGEEAAAPSSPSLTVVVSSPGSVEAGPGQRVLLALAAPDATFAGGPDLPASARFVSPAGSVLEVGTEWVWAIPDVRGYYAATADLPEPGRWAAALLPEQGEPADAAPFDVVEDSPIPAPGEPAPASETRTHPEFPLEQITSDDDPDPSLYDLTVAEAVGSGRPSVIVFATPAFCQTAVCGPTLDIVKETAADHPEAEFVHVEVYENIDSDDGEPLREVPAIAEWGLVTEPWVFVVDSDGIVTARYEGTVSPEELDRQLAALGA